MFKHDWKSLTISSAAAQVECLKQLKASGATPKEMTWFSLLNFAIPAMVKSMMLAVAVGIAYGVWK